MSAASLGLVVHRLRAAVGCEVSRGLTDAELLGRFTAERDEAAFAAIVERYGRLVLGVCRRVLRQEQDAEDAFQATFLILARKAGAIRKRESLPSWLHGVAFHVSMKARRAAGRRHKYERQVKKPPEPPESELTWRELQAVLEEEVARLPQTQRAVFVLCCLDGRSKSEVARLLGWKEGTVSARLARARKQLQHRLARRGVALSAALAALALEGGTRAALPAVLTDATVRGALFYATGQAPAGATATAVGLAEAALRTLWSARCKIATAVLLAAGVVTAGAGAAIHQVWAGQLPSGPSALTVTAVDRPTAPPEATAPGQAPGARAEAAAAQEPGTMTVTGRVLDETGKPVANVPVAVLARQFLYLCSWEGTVFHRNTILGRTRADEGGRFRLTVPRTPRSQTLRQVRVVAAAPGHGLGWKALDPDAEHAEADVRLTTEQVVRGRLVNLQGEPAVGVHVKVISVRRRPRPGERDEDTVVKPPADGFPFGPRTATADARGNFEFRGFGPNLKVELEISDPPYQRKDEWFIDTSDRKQCTNLRQVLGPGQVVEGRVVYADTRRPVPHAPLEIVSPYVIETQTDAEGRFRVSIFSGQLSHGEVSVSAWPHPGEPYVGDGKSLHFPKGVVRRQVELVLQRATILRGKVMEAGSGQPVAGAYVVHGRYPTCVTSGPDGRYAIGVPAGTLRLTVTHPSGDYIPVVVGSAGDVRHPVGDPSYYHAVMDVDVKPGERVKEVNVVLRHGVTLRGRLVGPDGKPVQDALMFISGHRPLYEKTMTPVFVRGGQFEVHGCDPKRTYRLLFLTHPRKPTLMMTTEGVQSFGQLWLPELLGQEHQLGAVVVVTAARAGETMTVRMKPVGSVRLHVRDAAGKPLAGYSPWVQLVVTPGPTLHDALDKKTLAAEVITLVGRYGTYDPSSPRTDARGEILFHGLIPGATYRIKKTLHEPINEILKEFTVEPGRTADVELIVN